MDPSQGERQRDDAVTRRCGNPPVSHEVWTEQRRRRQRTRAGLPPYTVLRVFYRLIFHTGSRATDLPSFQHLQAQHHLLLAALNAANADLSHVPTSGFYKYNDRIGNAKISLSPLDYRELTQRTLTSTSSPVTNAHVEYVEFPENKRWSESVSASPLSHYLSVFATAYPLQPLQAPGAVTIWVAPLGTAIFGQAQMGGPHCIISSPTVGSEVVPGTYPEFDLGKTLTHEIGHCLGLDHTFAPLTLEGKNIIPDLPPQYQPNYNFQLFPPSNLGGSWYGKFCNRWYDCTALAQAAGATGGEWGIGEAPLDSAQVPWSCLGCTVEAAEAEGPGPNPLVNACPNCLVEGQGEAALSHLDYGTDAVLLLYSPGQVDVMHEVLATDGASWRDTAAEVAYTEVEWQQRISDVVQAGYNRMGIGTVGTEGPVAVEDSDNSSTITSAAGGVVASTTGSGSANPSEGELVDSSYLVEDAVLRGALYAAAGAALLLVVLSVVRLLSRR